MFVEAVKFTAPVVDDKSAPFPVLIKPPLETRLRVVGVIISPSTEIPAGPVSVTLFAERVVEALSVMVP